MKKRYCLVLSAFLVWGCHSQSNSSNAVNQPHNNGDSVKHVQVPAKPIDKGMTDTATATSDPSIKYAVYLPASYTTTKKWPIIYFFDPHGAGDLPLNIYKSLADKYGYILAGTYNSKNGTQWAVTEKAAQAFMQDTWQRLSIDNNRIYTFGFSGGARVACSIALYDGGVAGVIACGGGFPERNPSIRVPFAFMGFVGDKDFNYTEMKQLDKALDNSQLPHQLTVYHGKHQWPPMAIAEGAMQWLEVNAMRMHFTPKNDSLVKSVQDGFVKEADKWAKQKNTVQEYFTYKKMLNYLKDLTDAGKYTSTFKDLEKSDKVQQYLQSEEADQKQEAQTQGALINSLSDKDMTWWQQTVAQMRSFVKTDSNSPVALQNQRLLNYLSLATYMGASQAFKARNDEATAHFLELYKLVDPTNPEHSYLYASMYARQNNASKALSNLEDAVKLGFNDLRRLQGDANFSTIKDQAGFNEIEKKMAALPHKVDMSQ